MSDPSSDMTENQYRELCVACDRLLLASDSTTERAAISWLHVIREHPVFLRGYTDLVRSEASVKGAVREWRRKLRYTAGWLRQLGRASLAEGLPWYGAKNLAGPIDVLFVSHLLNASQAGANDFYFGRLPDGLAERRRSVVISLINHSGEPGTTLAARWNHSAVPRIILSSSLGFKGEIALFRRLKNESFRLRRLAARGALDLFQRVAAPASQEAMSGGARSALRLGAQINALVSALKPKAVVVTYEGHAWERVAFAAARQARPAIRCIGYQHAALFRLQHAIRRNLGYPYDPDYVLTAGALGKRQLENAAGLRGVQRGFMKTPAVPTAPGAVKVVSCARRRCLVLPEGILSECHLLFEFALHCAKLCPEIEFVWRLHPLVTFKSLISANHNLRIRPPNIRLSFGAIESDLPGCSWALYRGTTAIVQAVGAGLQPIYLRIPGEMTIDPLYELGGWKASVETAEDFRKAVITTAENPKDNQRASEQESVRAYCQNMFEPFDVDVLSNLIDGCEPKHVPKN
ncbi:MAG TPA: hypothetical protein EYQ81_14275 [Sneathiellales bacterium]|nr:hypothetical protein [Sneathiellales bacterium]